MNSEANDLEGLRALVDQLSRRVAALERKLEMQPLPPSAPPMPAGSKLAGPSAGSPAAPPALSPLSQAPASSRPPAQPSIRQTGPIRTEIAREGLESRIGSHWLNRIGITAVLVGVSYFLKYAFDNNWIGASGRIAIGLLGGIAIVLWSERFRARGYKAFSYSLKALGVGTLYLSLWAAFQIYSLIPGGVTFASMLLVTASTVAMAIVQDAEILAAFALTGGFSTPLLLSTGQNHEIALFSYVALLDVAALALVILKPWYRLLLLSFFATLALYVGWYGAYYQRNELAVTLAFATLFFAIFAVSPLLARNPGEGLGSTSIPLFLSFVNAGVFFLQAYAMFESVDKTLMAWFAVGLAAIYLALSRLSQGRDPNAENARRQQLLHLAVAVGFITIAIPIRLEGHWITLGWFVEAAVLLWVADRITSDFLAAFSLVALGLGVVRLLVIDNFDTSTLLFNWRMLTYLVAIVVLALVAWFGIKRGDETGRHAAALAVIGLNILALVALSREVSDYFAREQAALPQERYRDWAVSPWRHLQIVESFTFSALWMAYGAMLMVVGFWRRSAFVRWQALFLIAATIVKVFVYDVWELDRGFRIVSFIILGVLLLAISFVYQRGWLQLSGQTAKSTSRGAIL